MLKATTTRVSNRKTWDKNHVNLKAGCNSVKRKTSMTKGQVKANRKAASEARLAALRAATKEKKCVVGNSLPRVSLKHVKLLLGLRR